MVGLTPSFPFLARQSCPLLPKQLDLCWYSFSLASGRRVNLGLVTPCWLDVALLVVVQVYLVFLHFRSLVEQNKKSSPECLLSGCVLEMRDAS